MVHIYAVSITDFPEETVPRLLSIVTAEKKQRLLAFYHRDDLVRGLLADLLIRKIAAERFAVPAKSILFGTNTYGKPSLLDPCSRLHFNLSHAGSWVVCITAEHPVGIDIEKKQAIDLQIASQFFAKEECAFIEEEADSKRRLERFFHVWTAKESYIKAIGKGLFLPLDSFSTVKEGSVEGWREYEQGDWFFKTYALDDDYALTACAQTESFGERVDVVPLDSLIAYFHSN
ncbi:4'-phosphopantetheinyl transferase family protein [Brevibacillus gelatini]